MIFDGLESEISMFDTPCRQICPSEEFAGCSALDQIDSKVADCATDAPGFSAGAGFSISPNKTT